MLSKGMSQLLADVTANILESLTTDRAENEYEELKEEAREMIIEDKIGALDWDQMDPETALQDPALQKQMLAILRSVKDHLSYMNGD